jgi:hypothetical protein
MIRSVIEETRHRAAASGTLTDETDSLRAALDTLAISRKNKFSTPATGQ